MKKFSITIGIILLVVVMAGTTLFFFYKKSYTEIIQENWSIELPKPKQELVSIDSGESFLGDGDRYHVFRYENNDNFFMSLNWIADKSEAMEMDVSKVIDRLKVSDDQYPDFQNSYRYFIKTHSDGSSMIWLIYIKETQRLYVIETIY